MSETLPASLGAPSEAHANEVLAPLPRITWGLFILLTLAGFFIAFGTPTGAAFLVGLALATIVAWRYPYFSFYLALLTAPLLGIVVSLSTGQFQFGERAFGGSIDVGLGEVVAGVVLIAWAFRILFLWHGRRDWNWKPWLPLLGPYALIVLAHAASMFAFTSPDPILVLKYTFRPVFLVYLTAVVLPANFIRSRRRLLVSLAVLTCVGLFFAFDGFRSLFSFAGGTPGLHRARPLPILGLSPIGENHNILAELLVFAAPIALAYGVLARAGRRSAAAFLAAIFMVGITLLTFARSAWIALFCQAIFLFATVWRDWVKKNVRALVVAGLFFVPLAAYMFVFSSQEGVKSSTDARAMLSSIALDLFRSSPWVGTGAGTFVDRVTHTWIFTFEFGTPMDSHGVLQKLAAETGALGLVAFGVVVLVLILTMRSTIKQLKENSFEMFAYTYLCAGVLGAFVYQLFNTTYWTPKLWLPVGILLAAGKIFLNRQAERDPDFLKTSHG